MHWQKQAEGVINHCKKQHEESYKKIKHALQTLQTTKWSTYCGATNKYGG